MSEKLLTATEKVLKFRNSNARYLRIPDNHFKEIEHGDMAEVAEINDKNKNQIKIIYIFKKR